MTKKELEACLKGEGIESEDEAGLDSWAEGEDESGKFAIAHSEGSDDDL